MTTIPNNLSLWKTVEKTDPKFVRPIVGKPYKGTSPNPYWLVHRATEVFGPCGIGWGINILNSEFLKADAGVAHFATIRLWYVLDGVRGEVEHTGGTVASGTRKVTGELFVDEDATKKSITDAMVKALSLLGFAGDIFSGRWDDDGYQESVQAEKEAERTAGDLAYAVIKMRECSSMAELKEEWEKIPRQIQRLAAEVKAEMKAKLVEGEAKK